MFQDPIKPSVKSSHCIDPHCETDAETLSESHNGIYEGMEEVREDGAIRNRFQVWNGRIK